MSSLGKRKRFLQLHPQQQDLLRQTIAEQIDLEIALKKRLLAAAGARVDWALALRNAIADPKTSTLHPPAAFRDAALATYEGIETPCHFITSASYQPVPPSADGRAPVYSDTRSLELPRTRKRGLGQGNANASSGPLLFEDRSTSTPVTLKLVCSDCARSDFPTMQGFLNHCRLGHARNYGTHDECIQTCGIIVDDSERAGLVAAGVEIKTIHLLSLKRIFERAVGLTSNASRTQGDVESAQETDKFVETSTHLSQTLGLHKDSPTLARFLGKEVKKKCIHVHDDSGPLDIVSPDDDPPKRQSSWLIRSRPRRHPDSDWSINMAAIAAGKTDGIQGPQHVLKGPTIDEGSRFHVTRRILIADRSLYLPESKRPLKSENVFHTHRWQISISSPSYEQHITTFLSRLIVTCVTQPPVFSSPIAISEPPFVACSTTDRPFLARLTLEWVGEQNNPSVVEHWVELDQFKTTRVVSGEEEMLDIELDRNTVFLSASTMTRPVLWNGDGDYEKTDPLASPLVESQIANAVAAPGDSEPEYVKILKSIVPRFPITLQGKPYSLAWQWKEPYILIADVGTRQPPKVPYELYPSPAKLLSLVPGRRKAIEWSRALAIRSEYDALNASASSSQDNVRLTSADVYRWLDSEGLFPRRRPKIQKTVAQPESVEVPDSSLKTLQRFCSICGVDVHFHIPGIPFQSLNEDDSEVTGFCCPVEMGRCRAPLVHVYALVAPLRIPYWALRHGQTHGLNTPNSPRDIVEIVHPQVTRFVRQEIASLDLSCFDTTGGADDGRDCHELLLRGNREEVDGILAPHAFIAIVLEKAFKDIVGSALQVARETQSRTKSTSGRVRGVPVSLLTTTHVLQGMMKGAEMGGPKEALFKIFSRVGTLLEAAGGVARHVE